MTSFFVGNNYIPKQFGGLLLYIGLFIIFIPIYLYKYKFFTILEGYLPNIDLLATCLAWHGGPYGIWAELYGSTKTVYGFISQSIINYGALLGLTYIIARESDLTNSAVKGWSLGFIMLLMTYLLPSRLIDYAMNYIYQITGKNIQARLVATLTGLLISISIIALESHIISYFRSSLIKIGSTILTLPRHF